MSHFFKLTLFTTTLLLSLISISCSSTPAESVLDAWLRSGSSAPISGSARHAERIRVERAYRYPADEVWGSVLSVSAQMGIVVAGADNSPDLSRVLVIAVPALGQKNRLVNVGVRVTVKPEPSGSTTAIAYGIDDDLSALTRKGKEEAPQDSLQENRLRALLGALQTSVEGQLAADQLNKHLKSLE
jgi:hypothetical protein